MPYISDSLPRLLGHYKATQRRSGTKSLLQYSIVASLRLCVKKMILKSERAYLLKVDASDRVAIKLYKNMFLQSCGNR